MIKEFWNERYASKEFAYGTEPNILFKAIIDKLPPCKILLAAEGEGRNAVYAATKGWQVDAFDLSEEGKQKAEKLADHKQVAIHYTVSSFEDFTARENSYDCIAFIFSHLPEAIRQQNYRKLLRYLKPGGLCIAIGFSEKQLGKSSGGPKELSMLFSEKQLREDFHELKDMQIRELDMELDEGPFHKGIGSLIEMTGYKSS
jgi:ubiquinone/menaquinone biosynthesis C-methylase UbiE